MDKYLIDNLKIDQLTNFIKLYLPYDNKIKIDSIKEIEKIIIEKAEGLTKYKGSGLWINQNILYTDKIQIIEFYHNLDNKNLIEILEKIKEYQIKTKEKEISIIFDNTLYFFDIEKIDKLINSLNSISFKEKLLKFLRGNN